MNSEQYLQEQEVLASVREDIDDMIFREIEYAVSDR